jgi:hypothetical protein
MAIWESRSSGKGLELYFGAARFESRPGNSYLDWIVRDLPYILQSNAIFTRSRPLIYKSYGV